MEAVKQYFIQNLGLLLILVAFAIILHITVFLEKKVIRRTQVLIGGVFLLSIAVFTEFYLEDLGGYVVPRLILMAIRYSATPLLLAQIIFTLIRNRRLYVFIPAAALLIVDIISIFTPIVFGIDDAGSLVRGPLGYLPYIVAGLYSVVLVYLLVRQSNRRAVEIIPIVFLAVSFALGLFLPFFLGKEFSALFCTIIGISLFVYFVFSIFDIAKKDPLTHLLNRQAYYADVKGGRKGVTALISVDMNGLKVINDTQGHASGDIAIKTVAECLIKASKRRQAVFRIGGDEFVIVCRKLDEQGVETLVKDAHKALDATPYSCSIGYCYDATGTKSIRDILKESDEMLYAEKARHYEELRNSSAK